MTGLVSHWHKYFAQLGNDCMYPLIVYAGDVRKIELLHMHGSYVVLGCGLLVSAVVLIIEMLYLGLRPKANKPSQMQGLYNKVQTFGRGGSPTAQEPLIRGPGQVRAANLANFAQAPGRPDDLATKAWRQAQQVASPANSPPRAPRAAAAGLLDPSLPPQYNTIYENQAANAYNTTASFNYYNYGDGAKNYRSKFGMQ